MPGKRGQGQMTLMLPWVPYRTVTAADSSGAGTAAIAAAVVDEINMSDCDVAVGNRLDAQVIMPSTVTSYSIELWTTMSKNIPGVSNPWARQDQLLGRTTSSIMTTKEVICGFAKVLITNVVGNFSGGNCTIIISRSA